MVPWKRLPDSQASEQAGGWAHEQQAGERASEQAKRGQLSAVRWGRKVSSAQAFDGALINTRWMCSQSLMAREGVSRWSSSRPWIDLLPYNLTSLREGWFTRIKLRFFLVKWNNFWCGLNDILGDRITLSSTIKNPQESWYPNKSGTPKDAQDSSLVHWIRGVFFLTNCQNLLSGFTRFLYNIRYINVTKNVSYFA